MDPMFENDLWEAQMKSDAVLRLERKRAAALSAGRDSTAEPYAGLMHAMVKAAIEELDARLRKRGRGRPNVALNLLRQAKLDTATLVFIATRSAIDGISQGHRLQALTTRLGGRVEDERTFRNFKRHSPKLYRWIIKSLAERGSQDYRHLRNTLRGAMNRCDEEIPRLGWTLRDRAQVGLLLVDVLVSTGMLLKFDLGSGKARKAFVKLSPEAEAAMSERSALVADLCRPWYRPTLVEPLDWASPTDGGYRTSEMDLDLVKTRNRQYIESLRSVDMPAVYTTINAVQRTAWRINEDVLVVMEELWSRRAAVAGLPLDDGLLPPPRPDLPPRGTELSDEEKATLRAWKSTTKAYFDGEKRKASRWSQTNQLLVLAAELRHRPALYFPHTLDYRGRAYAVPLVLNPQSSDTARGLLHFAEAKPVGEMGGFWLAVHGANLWGEDKVRLEDRVDWVLEHEAEIRATAADPLSDQWWAEADCPWQFLAWALEWVEFLDSGESPEFESRIPVSIDGSCNGLQHFSAMLRDSEGAAAVNLAPAAVPQDIYQGVADRVEARLAADAANPGDPGPWRLARAWQAYGVDRKLVKRQVMTTPYGVTRPGMLEQLVAEMNQRGDGEFEDLWGACQYLAGHIFEAIGDAVSGARAAMEFLQAGARLIAAADMPMRWSTPSGFPVLQEIRRRGQFSIDTQLLGRIQLRYSYERPELDRRRQVTSVSPNLVHSYDAAHLCRTVVAMEAGGPRSWAVVHDSFGTHAADVQELSEALRATFVEMYEGRDPLAEFAADLAAILPEGTELPAPPPRGDFDLRRVLEAEFFFA